MTALPFVWDGEAMVPRRGFQKRCDEVFVVGETYRLEPVEDRSAKSHAHYFASVAEGWANLPESLAAEYASPEHLRKRMLIKAGYYHRQDYVAASRAEALRVAAFIRPRDEYAVVTIDGTVVSVWTAKSQDMRSMGKREFGESKQRVLDLIAGLIGVERQELEQQGQAA